MAESPRACRGVRYKNMMYSKMIVISKLYQTPPYGGDGVENG